MTANALSAAGRGYPAWAGIDPFPHSVEIWNRGLPRVGGDRPRTVEGAGIRPGVTPRGRG